MQDTQQRGPCKQCTAVDDPWQQLPPGKLAAVATAALAANAATFGTSRALQFAFTTGCAGTVEPGAHYH
jgi:hypothetical protein